MWEDKERKNEREVVDCRFQFLQYFTRISLGFGGPSCAVARTILSVRFVTCQPAGLLR